MCVCHNPDTWSMEGGTEMTVDELLKEYETKKFFYKSGGITATGGETMVQIDFLTEALLKHISEEFIPVWIHQV